MQRVVVLPNGRDCGLGKYVAAWKALQAMPADRMVEGFDHFPEAAARILELMRQGLDDRINRHLPWFSKGRKWDESYQTGLARDARALFDHATRRMRVYQFNTPDVRARCGHLLATREEM